ncbi:MULTISPECIES: hypothetical protein [unclassified Myroides]|uniref:hypothetical protein n=1 Tax=unclassified Myroides TaxID=2642485 RepID=UPI003D2F53E1
MRKVLFIMSLLASAIFLFVACSSDDSNDKQSQENDSGSTFNAKGNWQLTVEDEEDEDFSGTYRFSTDTNGLSHDKYGEISVTQLAYKDQKLQLNFIDLYNEVVPSIIFDAPDPKATKFVTVEKHIETDDNDNEIRTFTTTITLERLSK